MDYIYFEEIRGGLFEAIIRPNNKIDEVRMDDFSVKFMKDGKRYMNKLRRRVEGGECRMLDDDEFVELRRRLEIKKKGGSLYNYLAKIGVDEYEIDNLLQCGISWCESYTDEDGESGQCGSCPYWAECELICDMNEGG
jgi:hypothetical protein